MKTLTLTDEQFDALYEAVYDAADLAADDERECDGEDLVRARKRRQTLEALVNHLDAVIRGEV